MNPELAYVRDLAKETQGYALSDTMNARRALWSHHNSLKFTRPPIYMRAVPYWELFPEESFRCADEHLRELEKYFTYMRYQMQIDDDYIIEPYLAVQAEVYQYPEGPYGVPAALGEGVPRGGAAAFAPTIVDEEDIEKLRVADYAVDERATAEKAERLHDAVGGILDIVVDRQGALCRMWNNDISTLLAKMRGLEQIMYDPYDRPEWFHRLLGFMQQKILMHIDQTEQAGAFRLANHQNQAMPYADELPWPDASDKPVSPKQLWVHMASQEYTTFGPGLFDEFMLQYQKPIMERYGLAAYGCCEDLTLKIPLLRTLPNLRRIAVSPFANAAACAEQIQGDYVLSWRPNPSSAVSFGVDEGFVRRELREAFDAFDQNGCVFDITLKDVETVSGDIDALPRWTAIVRDEISRRYGL